MKTTYKEIHLGAIATFYVIAISLRLITLVIGKSYPTIRETHAFQLATGLGPAIGALVAMAVFKRKTEYTITGKSVWKSIVTIAIPCIAFGIVGGVKMGVLCLLAFGGIRLARILAIRTQKTTRVAVCPYHHGHVVSMAFGLWAAKHIAFSRTSAFRRMGNRKNRNRHPFASFVLGISWHRELLEERATFRYHIPC